MNARELIKWWMFNWRTTRTGTDCIITQKWNRVWNIKWRHSEVILFDDSDFVYTFFQHPEKSCVQLQKKCSQAADQFITFLFFCNDSFINFSWRSWPFYLDQNTTNYICKIQGLNNKNNKCFSLAVKCHVGLNQGSFPFPLCKTK